MIGTVLLSIGSAIAFYVLVGYPLWLAFFGESCRREVAKQPGFRTTVSIVMSVYNGARFIRAKLESLLALD